ncbi:WD40 repeat domain-containing protein [Chitinophaga arvensicola]|uniref:Uncharacterized protein n=1 Tax=Chitinophaga arvensicola TaxID=29529 RepID=A0A1I0S6S7_9BACT|nr:hypothetical protein [Chitinophaga arvensicola]SEW51364.1 hypothetical protein SAMN04488122_4215 [Chitinophaga arvensicola]
MSNWKTLTGGGGSRMILHGEYAVAAELHRITVWKKEQLWCQQTVDKPQPGFPRLVNDQLYWGAGVMNLTTRQWQDIPGIWNTLASQAATNYDGYTPTVFSWSPDAAVVAVSVKWTGQPGPPPAKVLLLNSEGQLLQTLWEDSDLPVAALYVSDKWILAGTRQFRLFDKDTFASRVIPEKLPAVKIDMTADEQRLLLLQYDHIGLWDAATGKEIHRWKGQWNDAAITPDGKYMIAVDFDGKAFRVHTDTPEERQVLSAPGAIFSVAADNDRLLAFFMEGAVVRITTLL